MNEMATFPVHRIDCYGTDCTFFFLSIHPPLKIELVLNFHSASSSSSPLQLLGWSLAKKAGVKHEHASSSSSSSLSTTKRKKTKLSERKKERNETKEGGQKNRR